MSNFSRKSFGNKSFGGQGRSDRRPKQMHEAKCATCGKTFDLPFRPTGDRPVYCNDCFVKEDSSRGPRRDFSPRKSFGNDRPAPRPDQAFNDLKAELRVVNQNLERLIAIMTPAPVVEEVKKAVKTSKKKVSKKKKN